MQLLALSLSLLVFVCQADEKKPTLRELRDKGSDEWVECCCRSTSSGVISSISQISMRAGTCPHCDGSGVCRPSIAGSAQDIACSAADCGLGFIPVAGGVLDAVGGLHNTITPWVDLAKGERSGWDATKRCAEGVCDIGLGVLSAVTFGIVGGAKNAYKAGRITKDVLEGAKKTGKVLKHVSTGITAAKGVAKAVEAGSATDFTVAAIGGAMGHIGNLDKNMKNSSTGAWERMKKGHYNAAIQAGSKTAVRLAAGELDKGAQEAICGGAACGLAFANRSSTHAVKTNSKNTNNKLLRDYTKNLDATCNNKNFLHGKRIEDSLKAADHLKDLGKDIYKTTAAECKKHKAATGQKLAAGWKQHGGHGKVIYYLHDNYNKSSVPAEHKWLLIKRPTSDIPLSGWRYERHSEKGFDYWVRDSEVVVTKPTCLNENRSFYASAFK